MVTFDAPTRMTAFNVYTVFPNLQLVDQNRPSSMPDWPDQTLLSVADRLVPLHPLLTLPPLLTWYTLTALPPSDAGGDHFTVAEVVLTPTQARLVGLPGTVAAVVASKVGDHMLRPSCDNVIQQDKFRFSLQSNRTFAKPP